MVKPFTPEDLALFQDLGQLDVSSRGVAACVVRSVDMAQDGYVSTIWTFPLDAAPARRFTLGTSGENCPRWSPDGRTLAFVSPRDGLPQVHLIAADGGEARQLSHLRFGVGSIQWSPDGTKLLATCALPLDPDSGEAAALADEPRSPDAPEVAWRVPYKSDGTGYLLARAFHMCSIDAATGEDTPVTRGAFDVMASCWSPDSTRIAYVRTREGREAHRTDLWIANADGSEARQVTRDYASVMSPRWSPDGRWILYSMAVAGNTDVYKVSSSGGGAPVKLTDSPGIDVGGSFSPDGSRIVFESDRSGSQQIYVMNADGSDQKRISFFGGRAATPEWSPRGDQIAFTHIAGNLRVAVMSPGGGGLRHLTDSWQDEAPTWSPNGRIIQFFRTTKTSGKTAIWQVDLTGRNERKLPTPVDGSDPSWGPIRP